MINIILVYPWESPLQQQELEVGDTACVYFSTERLSMTPWTTTERERYSTVRRKVTEAYFINLHKPKINNREECEELKGFLVQQL